MVVEEPLLRLGVILALAAGGVVLLLLLTLVMYACCKGYRGPATPPNLPIARRQDVSAIYSPTVITYRHENAEVCPIPLPTSILRSTHKPCDDCVNHMDCETHVRGRTPPPSYEEVVCPPPPEKAFDEHNYST